MFVYYVHFSMIFKRRSSCVGSAQWPAAIILVTFLREGKSISLLGIADGKNVLQGPRLNRLKEYYCYLETIKTKPISNVSVTWEYSFDMYRCSSAEIVILQILMCTVITYCIVISENSRYSCQMTILIHVTQHVTFIGQFIAIPT